jgi:hypothetical protein
MNQQEIIEKQLKRTWNHGYFMGIAVGLVFGFTGGALFW